MKPMTTLLSWLGFLACVSILAGCNTVYVSSHQYLGVPQYPPTDWSTVEILHKEPTRPHEQIGQIELQPSGDPPVAEMEEKLKQAAAALGAHAALIVFDGSKFLGEVVTGPRWARTADARYGRIIIAVAIR